VQTTRAIVQALIQDGNNPKAGGSALQALRDADLITMCDGNAVSRILIEVHVLLVVRKPPSDEGTFSTVRSFSMLLE
jgi:hypothetical protein